jgi:hypothetical protein
MSYAMSLVILVDASTLGLDLSGVEVAGKPDALDTELDEVLEYVRFRSITRRV